VGAPGRLRNQPGNAVVVVKPVPLVFPILGAASAVVLLARNLGLFTPLLARVAPRLRKAAYFAVRRIVRVPGVTVGLLVGTALPIALLTCSGMVAYGTHAEIALKYRTNLGAPDG
jgi:hypothetical protein